VPGGGNGAYSATKHAVVGLSETLRLELSLHAPAVGVTVLCPGPVPSRIHDAARNRPDDGTPPDADGSAARSTDFGLVLRRVPADEVAQQVLRAIEARREYVVTSSDIVPLARARVEHLLAELSEG
jgi:short-subunit dehydrogenase